MELGIVGLGRMGGNISQRLMRAGHKTVVYDRNEEVVHGLADKGAQPSTGLADMVAKLTPPRAVWVMLPAGKITESTVSELADLMQSGDTIIDGGNTYYKDDIRRAHTLQGEGHRLCGRGHVRRHLGDRARLLHDDRRREGGRGPAGPDLRHAGARHRHHREDAGARRARSPVGAGLHPRGSCRGRALREDGPQRHRVRHHAGVRGGLRHPPQQDPARTCRSTSGSRSTTPRWPKPGGAAASSAPGCWT